jgi:glycosyltransferase involved in cell wall biosynthesis
MNHDYVVAVQAPAYAVSPTVFATESAFAEHLKELRRSVGPRFTRLVLIAPQWSATEYATKKEYLGIVELERDEILFVPAHRTDTSAKRFWFSQVGPVWKRISDVVSNASLVHSGLADDIYRPMLAMVNFAAWKADRPLIFVVDIDFRKHAWRYYKTGLWGRKSYLINRIVYDPIKWVQVWLAVRCFQLVLLKSASMVAGFGQGRNNVKNFYDTVHAAADVLTDTALASRMAWLRDPDRPLQIAYFGRFVPYKGLDCTIEAVRLAREKGADIRLLLIGDGESRTSLEQQVRTSGLESAVRFLPPVRYGKALFDLLEQAHMSIATPLVEDTPRAAFDSMARGLPIAAFDITYFRDLAAESGAVALAAWPNAEAMALELIALSRNRDRLAAMAQRGVEFALINTQSLWLERRAQWTLKLITP